MANGLHKCSVKPVRQGQFDLVGVALFPMIITALLYLVISGTGICLALCDWLARFCH
jgi:hypothetical protein